MTRLPLSALVGCAALLVTLGACGDNAEEETPAAEAAAAVDSPAPVTAPPAASGTFLDPNAASAEELQSQGRIPASAAQALVTGRPYSDMTAVDRVLAGQNVTEEQRDSVYTRIWMPIDLNSASGEEIMLIPGVGERMRHEFEEYRPYRSMEQFRREIGKYVDDEEVARLEQYVTIRQ